MLGLTRFGSLRANKDQLLNSKLRKTRSVTKTIKVRSTNRKQTSTTPKKTPRRVTLRSKQSTTTLTSRPTFRKIIKMKKKKKRIKKC